MKRNSYHVLRVGLAVTLPQSIAGAWKYHDHLTPKDFGAITVE